MAVYVMSDVHGLKDRYDRMMENIDKYLPATVEGFEELLQRAKDINNSATATQDEINKITEGLIIAILDARLDPSK